MCYSDLTNSEQCFSFHSILRLTLNYGYLVQYEQQEFQNYLGAVATRKIAGGAHRHGASWTVVAANRVPSTRGHARIRPRPLPAEHQQQQQQQQLRPQGPCPVKPSNLNDGRILEDGWAAVPGRDDEPNGRKCVREHGPRTGQSLPTALEIESCNCQDKSYREANRVLHAAIGPFLK
ncbi:uncharacterized protein LOC124717091 [Schistocerca piceifrons]|uniref:uncharacterized protein LOC124717091 n=1 Tax=Schistocerca piceifrons TaxID=274613 RepID=UPI001F5E8B91|nr:uncharacterized protein LOC124717091 [Schistocerca piceifrons]